MNARKNSDIPVIMYDRILLWLTFGLLTIGLVMVTSASMSINQYMNEDLFYFSKRDTFYIVLSCIIALVILSIPMNFWQHYSNVMLIISVIMLLTVLLVGHSVNGASRWITLGPLFYIQPSELTKLSLFCYLSSYLMRKIREVRNTVWGLCKPLGIISIISILLLAQPDLGTVVVLFITTLAMLFLAGTKMWQFLGIIIFSILTGVIIITSKQYRMSRIISFCNPWEDPFGRGYQLTQSLMAFGRGQLWGQGLGNSVQKLNYLPEAHTDFIFSIIGEELGYIGVVSILLMIFFLAVRAMLIGHRALKINQCFSGFLAIAIGIWFGFQVFVNVGTAVGILPTKGLTLPLISYGGSSLSIMSIAISFLLRIDYETRLTKVKAFILN